MQEEGPAGQGAGAGEEGAQVPVQGHRDHAAAAMPRRPLLPHGNLHLHARPRCPFYACSFVNHGAFLSLFCNEIMIPAVSGVRCTRQAKHVRVN